MQDWMEGRAASPVQATRWPALGLIPANLGLNRLRDDLNPARKTADARRLAERLTKLRAAYDWVLLDCPAGLNALTINALVAADRLLVPVGPPDALSLDGMQHIVTSMDRIKSSMNSGLCLLGALVSNAQLGRAAQRRAVERMREQSLPILDTVISSSARVAAAAEMNVPLIAHAPRSAIADANRALSVEIEQRSRAAG